jgi:hypothetical protein
VRQQQDWLRLVAFDRTEEIYRGSAGALLRDQAVLAREALRATT